MTTRLLWIYLAPLLFLLGSVGNVLSLIVLCHKNMRQTSTYVYLGALAVFDQLVLLSGLLRFWMEKLLGWPVEVRVDDSLQIQSPNLSFVLHRPLPKASAS